MIGAEILQNLFDQRKVLSDIIINSSPKNDDQRKQLQALMKSRDAITGMINQIIAKKFNEAAGGLSDKVSNLKKLTDRLNKLNKTIDDVNTAIQITDQIIKVVTSILALAISL